MIREAGVGEDDKEGGWIELSSTVYSNGMSSSYLIMRLCPLRSSPTGRGERRAICVFRKGDALMRWENVVALRCVITIAQFAGDGERGMGS